MSTTPAEKPGSGGGQHHPGRRAGEGGASTILAGGQRGPIQPTPSHHKLPYRTLMQDICWGSDVRFRRAFQQVLVSRESDGRAVRHYSLLITHSAIQQSTQ